MSRTHLRYVVTVMMFCLPFFSSTATALAQPDCASLAEWGSAHASKQTIKLAPEVEISGMFADSRTTPLFGASVTTWERNDFRDVKKWLNECRRSANKSRDKKTADTLYQAYKVVNATARPLYRMEMALQQSDRAVTNLVNYHRSTSLQQVLGLADRALRGEDVRNEMRGLKVTHSVRGEVQSLQNNHAYLSTADIEQLSSRLKTGAGAVEQEMAEHKQAFEDLQQQLEAVPLTREGAYQLDKLNKDPVLGKVSRDEAMAFRNAVMKKRMAISHAIKRQSATTSQQASTQTDPGIALKQLNNLLAGDSIDKVSLRGIRPGIQYLYAKRMAKHRFNYKAGAGGDLMKEFAPTRRDFGEYKKRQGRDGGFIEFETMGKKVGLVRFTEHYLGRIDLKQTREGLIQRFGKPDQSNPQGNGLAMTWQDDGINLEVIPANRTAVMHRSPRIYRSSLVVTLWSDDYREYLQAAKERCQALRNKPMNELSMNDKAAILRGCKE